MKKTKKKITYKQDAKIFFTSGLVAFVLGLLVSGMVQDARSSTNGVQEFVQNISDEAIGIIQNGNIPTREKEQKLGGLFKENVNTQWMGRFVTGQYFRKANDEQRQKFLGLYEEFLVASYIPKFKQYAGEKLKILNVLEKGQGEYLVQTELVATKNNQPIRVDYRIKRGEDGALKVIDIIGEGISLITTQRSDFAGILSQQGMAAFLEKLEAKTAQLKQPK